jgi:nitrite reductase/ring-hydroxylating ferredoxin subunit
MAEVRVEDIVGLAHGQARVFHYVRDGQVEQGFVLRVHERFVAYRNLCAHWHVDLDMGEGVFWSERLQRIQCRTHGAAYDPFSGVCELGPCVGARLSPLAFALDGDDAVVTVPG